MTFKPSGRARLYGCIAAANHGVTLAQLFGECRKGPIVRARWDMWTRMYRDGISAAQIGKQTNRDHTTVLYALRKGEAR